MFINDINFEFTENSFMIVFSLIQFLKSNDIFLPFKYLSLETFFPKEYLDNL